MKKNEFLCSYCNRIHKKIDGVGYKKGDIKNGKKFNISNHCQRLKNRELEIKRENTRWYYLRKKLGKDIVDEYPSKKCDMCNTGFIFRHHLEKNSKVPKREDIIIKYFANKNFDVCLNCANIKKSDITFSAVYLFHSEELNLYKIGYSINPKNRINQIKNHYFPSKDWTILKLYYIKHPREKEKELHNHFSDFHYKYEYFSFGNFTKEKVLKMFLEAIK